MRSRRRRIAITFLLAVAALLVLGAVASGISLLRAADDLTSGRDALLGGRRAILAGRIEDGVRAFEDAHVRFSAASADVGGPIGWFAATIPVLGNHVDVARAIADAGIHGATAGTRIAEVLASFPDGVDGLAPTTDGLPVDRYARLADAAGIAGDEAALALAALEDAPTTFLLGPVLEARWEAEADVRDASRALTTSQALLEQLPSFAGASGPRRYLVVSVNPAELRGTGGLWGAYAILTFRDGRASVGPAAPLGSLPEVSVDDVPPPGPDYRATYDVFGGAASWQNMNMTPDFPSAARAALGNLEAGGGPALDGVIAADPVALQAMLEITGPYPVPGTDVEVSSDNVLAFMLNDAYGSLRFEGAPAERKRVLGAVAAGIFERFLGVEGRTMAKLRVLGGSASGGHVRLYSVDAGIERAFELAGVAGRFGGGDGADLAAVTVNNGSANKVDQWAERSVSYEVALGGEGEAMSTLTTAIGNEAPVRGAPRYVIGPNAPGLQAGDQRPVISISCPGTCRIRGATLDDGPVTYQEGTELGTRWFRSSTTIAPSATAELMVSWSSTDVWRGDDSVGSYRLTYPAQPTLVPTDLSVTIHAPPGTRIVWSNVPMAIDGGTARWEGVATPSTTLEVRFRAPIPLRWLRDLSRAFGG